MWARFRSHRDKRSKNQIRYAADIFTTGGEPPEIN
jgi:hypothetical protein